MSTDTQFLFSDHRMERIRDVLKQYLKKSAYGVFQHGKRPRFTDVVSRVEHALKVDIKDRHPQVELGLRMWYLNKFLLPITQNLPCSHVMRFWLRTRALVYRPESARAPDLHFALGDSRHGHFVRAWGLLVRSYTKQVPVARAISKMVDLQLCERDADSLPRYPYVHARRIPGSILYGMRMFHLCHECGRLSPKQCQYFGLCGRCRNSRYCSEACQRRHWRVHKHCCFDRHADKQHVRLLRGAMQSYLMIKLLAPVFVEVVALQMASSEVKTPFYQFVGSGRNSLNFDIVPLKMTPRLLQVCTALDKSMLTRIMQTCSKVGEIETVVVLWMRKDELNDGGEIWRYTMLNTPSLMLSVEDRQMLREYFESLQVLASENPTMRNL
jgi:hypothetical protein